MALNYLRISSAFFRFILFVVFSVFVAGMTSPTNCVESALFESSCAFAPQVDGAISILILLPSALLFCLSLRRSINGGLRRNSLLVEIFVYIAIFVALCSYPWLKKNYVLSTCHRQIGSKAYVPATSTGNGINYASLSDFDTCLTQYYGADYSHYISDAEVKIYAR